MFAGIISVTSTCDGNNTVLGINLLFINNLYSLICVPN